MGYVRIMSAPRTFTPAEADYEDAVVLYTLATDGKGAQDHGAQTAWAQSKAAIASGYRPSQDERYRAWRLRTPKNWETTNEPRTFNNSGKLYGGRFG